MVELVVVLSIDHGHSVQVVMRMLVVVLGLIVASHNQFLLYFFEADGSYRLCLVTRDVQISHVDFGPVMVQARNFRRAMVYIRHG